MVQIAVKTFFVIKKVKNTVLWTYVQKVEFKIRVQKVIKRRGDKLFVKWKRLQ